MKKVITCILLVLILCGCSQNAQDNRTVDTSSYYDYVLCDAGDFLFVAKMEETVTDVVEYVGVINNEFEWIVPLSSNTPLHSKNGLNSHWSKFEDKCDELKYCISYMGDGVFSYVNPYGNADGYCFLISSTNAWFDVPRYKSPFKTFQNGYLIASQDEYRSDHNHVILISSSGNVTKTDILCYGQSYLGPYSEGLFFAYDGFYDINCNRVINLSAYAGRITNHPYFSNGICELVAENENGTKFVATIDDKGNFISEFVKK